MMDGSIKETVAALRTLARRRGWSALVQQIDAIIRDDAANSIWLAPATGINATRLRAWLSHAVPGSNVLVQPLEEIAANPIGAASADKLIAVFECGRLIDADALDALAEFIYTRPAHTYGFVFVGAESVADAEELAVMERAIWRLLVPDPKPDWAGQSLIEHSCFLWSDGPASDFLAERARRDCHELALWLNAPAACRRDLERWRLLSLIDAAEEEAEGARGSEARLAADRAQSIATRTSAARTDVIKLRRQLTHQLDADGASIQRQLTASLQTLEQDLVQDLHRVLTASLPRSGFFGESSLRSLLTRHIAEGSAKWRIETENLLMARSREIRQDAERLLGGFDWQIVNDLLARVPEGSVYPGALLERFSLAVTAVPGLERNSGYDAGSPALWSVFALPNLLSGAVATAALVATAGLLGLWQAGALGAVLAALAGGRHVVHNLRESEQFGREVIRAIIIAAISSAEESTRSAIVPLRQWLYDELGRIEALLDGAARELAGPQSDGLAGDRVALDEYRRRVFAAGTA